MLRLTVYELAKIWRKRSYLVAVMLLLLCNIFVLWYQNLPGEVDASFSSLKAFQRDISGMSASERSDYVRTLKETMDGVLHVQQVLTLRSIGGEMGQELLKQELAQHPGMFEAYRECYESGAYLKYTDSLEAESSFIDGLYEEMEKVSDYNVYLQEVQSNKDKKAGISIFQKEETDGFTGRNLQQSAADYKNLTAKDVLWYPAKPVKAAMEGGVSDVLLFLLLCLFVGGLITEEKEKGLFFVTRITRNGIWQDIIARIAALFINCFLLTILFYGANLLFVGCSAGFVDFMVPLQSLAPYMESCLSVTILEYICLSVVTKAMVIFIMGLLLVLMSICSCKRFVPYFAACIVFAVSFCLYTWIPAYSDFKPFKYLNVFGLLKTGQIYGGYLNMNLFGYPVRRLNLTWIVIIACMLLGVLLSAAAFARGKRLWMEGAQTGKAFSSVSRLKAKVKGLLGDRCHGLLYYEAYKLLIIQHGLLVLLSGAVWLISGTLSVHYSSSAQEQYYRDIMLELEGKLTDEKAAMIAAEEKRYEDAFAKIEEIDKMISEGEITEIAGEDLKQPWYLETVFYPSFQRVLSQYETVKNDGGSFVYDTGYRYLFGMLDNRFFSQFLILTLVLILAFGNVMTMEYQKKSWNLLSATRVGRGQIMIKKGMVCVLASCTLLLCMWVVRVFHIVESFPLHHGLEPMAHIYGYHGSLQGLPIIAFLLAAMLTQIAVAIFISGIIYGISSRCKSYFQTLFFSFLLLLVPLILQSLKVKAAGWFSLYGLYQWMSK
ncbi:MAG: hypothetical protein K2G89_08050 [Lachnospiraceae bacterium]|nr:hypothetical protein [Lachnospiraceae bacterium]